MAAFESREQMAKRYQSVRQKLALWGLVWTPLMLLVILIPAVNESLYGIAAATFTSPYSVLALYFLLLSLFLLFFDLPLSFYSGYILEHQFQLSNQSVGGWLWQSAKQMVLSFVLSLILVIALYALIWNFQSDWWWIAWIAYAAVSYIMGKLFPVFIVPLFYRYGKLEDAVLKEKILAMATKYEMPVENVFSLNLSKTTKKANAAFMGIGKTKRVVLSDTLLSHFTHDEIETVVAHELGHYKHKDIWKQLAFGLVSSLAAFWLAYHILPGLALFFGLKGAGDVQAMPLLFLVFYLFSVILMPLQNGFSRWMERLADQFSLDAYPKPDVFISCMNKLADVNLSDKQPHPVYEWFFFDHPAISRRIAMAKKWAEQRT